MHAGLFKFVMAIKAQYNKEDKVKKYSHFHEKKPTISENVNFAGGCRIFYKSEDINYYHQKKSWKNDLTLMWKALILLLL